MHSALHSHWFVQGKSPITSYLRLLHMRRVVRNLHDLCAIYTLGCIVIHSWLWSNLTVTVRVRGREWLFFPFIFLSFLFLYLSYCTFCNICRELISLSDMWSRNHLKRIRVRSLHFCCNVNAFWISSHSWRLSWRVLVPPPSLSKIMVLPTTLIIGIN